MQNCFNVIQCLKHVSSTSTSYECWYKQGQPSTTRLLTLLWKGLAQDCLLLVLQVRHLPSKGLQCHLNFQRLGTENIYKQAYIVSYPYLLPPTPCTMFVLSHNSIYDKLSWNNVLHCYKYFPITSSSPKAMFIYRYSWCPIQMFHYGEMFMQNALEPSIREL